MNLMLQFTPYGNTRSTFQTRVLQVHDCCRNVKSIYNSNADWILLMWKAVSQKATLFQFLKTCVLRCLRITLFLLIKTLKTEITQGPQGVKVSAHNVISHHINPCTTHFSLGIVLLSMFVHFHFQTTTRKACLQYLTEAQRVWKWIINLRLES